MKAITQSGNTLVWQDVPNLNPREGEVLVRVHAAGVNRADLCDGAESIGLPLDDHIANVIAALRPHAAELGLPG